MSCYFEVMLDMISHHDNKKQLRSKNLGLLRFLCDIDDQ